MMSKPYYATIITSGLFFDNYCEILFCFVLLFFFAIRLDAFQNYRLRVCTIKLMNILNVTSCQLTVTSQ